MSPDEYGIFLKELRYNYELKMPDPDIARFWFGTIKHIPGEALSWMQDRILSTYPDRFPKRFTGVMGQVFQEWLRANPHKRAQEDDCSECDHGWVIVDELQADLYHEKPIPVAYLCGKCRVSRHGVMTLTKSSARKQGMVLSAEVVRQYHFKRFEAVDWATIGQIAGFNE